MTITEQDLNAERRISISDRQLINYDNKVMKW